MPGEEWVLNFHLLINVGNILQKGLRQAAGSVAIQNATN
jgi:hypothetical protein